MLSVYGVIITYLVYDYYPNQELYMKDKVDYINNKTMEVSARERVISGREACDKELMRIKTIHKSALDVLNSYNTLTTPL
jgi:hypothetical protein